MLADLVTETTLQGLLAVHDAYGREFAIGCGVHRSSPVLFEHATDDLPIDAPGFDGDCAECQSTLEQALDAIRRVDTPGGLRVANRPEEG